MTEQFKCDRCGQMFELNDKRHMAAPGQRAPCQTLDLDNYLDLLVAIDMKKKELDDQIAKGEAQPNTYNEYIELCARKKEADEMAASIRKGKSG